MESKMIKNKIKDKVIWLFFVIFLFLSPFLQANTVLESLVETGVRKVLRLTERPLLMTEWEVHEASRKLTQRIVLEIKDLPAEKAAKRFEELLVPKHLAELMKTLDDVPQKARLIESLSESKSQFAVARRIIVNDFLAKWRDEPQAILRMIWKKAQEVISRGEKLDQERVLGLLLTKGAAPNVWFLELQAQIARGEKIAAEELVAYTTLLDPINDLILAESLDLLFFRKALVMSFWRKNPKEVHHFFDNIAGVVIPEPKKDLLAGLLVDLPATVFNALHPDRRSKFFLFGLPGSYAEDKMSHLVKTQFIRLLNMQALETQGILSGYSQFLGFMKRNGKMVRVYEGPPLRTFRDFLVQAIEKIEQEGFINQWLNKGNLKELKAQLELLDLYEKAFKGTIFDILDPAISLKLEDVLEEEVLTGMRSSYKWEWVRHHAKLLLLTSLFCVVDAYFEGRPEEIIDPQTLNVENAEMQKAIDLKIELVQIKLKSEKDHAKIKALEEYLQELLEMRRRYSK